MRGPQLKAAGRAATILAVVGMLGVGVAVKESIGSDHQQTALTELNPQIDITDTWAFPGSSPDRTVLAMTLASPLVGSRNAKFDPNALYQIKIDNNQDGREDLVLQFSFDMLVDGNMTFDVIGPVAPRPATGQFFTGPVSGEGGPPGVRDHFSTEAPVIRGAAMNSNSVTGNLPAVGTTAAGSIQAFAGLVDDPFYVDLEQFFRIIPDRRPTQGPLSQIGGVIPAPIGTVASSFRPACVNGEQQLAHIFNGSFGCARDFLAGFNALAIVVEVPTAQLTRGLGGADPQLGVWATVSR